MARKVLIGHDDEELASGIMLRDDDEGPARRNAAVRASVGGPVALRILLLALAMTGCSSAAVSQPIARDAAPHASITAAAADDPSRSDPDKYEVVFENERVRILRYRDVPGAKTRQHRHPDSVLYALSPFKRKLRFPDGTSREREFKTGEVMWVPAQTHIGENTGSTNTEVLLVEPKQPNAR